MIFWVVAIAVTAAVLYAVARPFLRPPETGTGDSPLNAAAYDVAVFRSQLREIERDLARSRITPEEAEASRVEIGRRLLAADRRQSAAARPGASGPSKWRVPMQGVAGIIVAASVVFSILIYARMGDPRNPDMPLVLRAAERELARTGGGAGAGTATPEAPNPESAGAGTLDDMAARLRTRLESGEGGPEDWSLLGRTEMMRGNYDAAATAYGEALKDFPDDPDLNSAYGEALVFWGNGTVSDQAYTVFQRVLRDAPNDVRARFYSADYDRQQGQYRAALDAWIGLIREAGPDSPWVDVVRERARLLAQEMGLDLPEDFGTAPAITPDAPPALGSLSEAVAGSRGPSQQDIEAAGSMSPDERQDMIAGMVDTLAARLEDNPDDVQGWIMLGRSYMVLNRPAEAITALERASELAPRNTELLIERGRLLRAEAGDRQTPETVALMHQVEALDPTNIEALWFLGLDAFKSEDRDSARAYFDRALAVLPDGSADHAALLEEVRRLFPDGN